MEISAKGRECAADIIESLGYELVDVEYAKEEGVMCLTFYIYSESGVSLDDCEKVSAAIEDIVEQADVTNGKAYYLCVSSPGERPLKNQRDFERNVGKKVCVELTAPIKGKKKKFVGVLTEFDPQVVINDGKEVHAFDTNIIKTVKPYIGF